MADRKLETLRKQVFAVYSKVRAARQEMGDIVDALNYRDPDRQEFDKMWGGYSTTWSATSCRRLWV